MRARWQMMAASQKDLTAELASVRAEAETVRKERNELRAALEEARSQAAKIKVCAVSSKLGRTTAYNPSPDPWPVLTASDSAPPRALVKHDGQEKV